MEPPLGHLEFLTPTESVDWLIVAPHPDDEAYGPGGLALLKQAEGVAAVIATDGARGAGGRGEAGLAERRMGESIGGLKLLGCRFGYFLQQTSGDLQSSVNDAARGIRWAVDTFRPHTVVTTSPFEHHPTHRATTRATLAALRGCPIEKLLGYAVWGDIVGNDGVELVDISAVIDQKLAALGCHQSQIEVRAFDEAVRCRNRFEALMDGPTGEATAEYVERFIDMTELIRDSGPDLSSWLRHRTEAAMQEWLQ